MEDIYIIKRKKKSDKTKDKQDRFGKYNTKHIRQHHNNLKVQDKK